MDDHHLPEGILKIQNISEFGLAWYRMEKIERYMSLQGIRQDSYLKAALYKEGAVINRDTPWQGEFSCLGSLGPARWRTACGKRHSRCACQSVTLWKSGQRVDIGENFFRWATTTKKKKSCCFDGLVDSIEETSGEQANFTHRKWNQYPEGKRVKH